MHQLRLPLPAERPQFRFKFPRAVDSVPRKNPWLAALECDFRHAGDGRKWRARCWLKRQLCRGYSKLGYAATEAQLSRFLGIPPRTVRWGIRMLKAQGFVSNVRRQGWNGPMLRELHPSLLHKREYNLYDSLGPRSTGPRSVRHSFASGRESCRPTPRESCRVTSPQSREGRPGGFQLKRKPQELGGAENRRSSPPSFQGNPTQRTRYAQVGVLIAKAVELKRRGVDAADLAEELKCFAARAGIDYSHTPAGCNSPIVQAVWIAEMRLGDPDGRFAPFGARERGGL